MLACRLRSPQVGRQDPIKGTRQTSIAVPQMLMPLALQIALTAAVRSES